MPDLRASSLLQFATSYFLKKLKLINQHLDNGNIGVQRAHHSLSYISATPGLSLVQAQNELSHQSFYTSHSYPFQLGPISPKGLGNVPLRAKDIQVIMAQMHLKKNKKQHTQSRIKRYPDFQHGGIKHQLWIITQTQSCYTQLCTNYCFPWFHTFSTTIHNRELNSLTLLSKGPIASP